MNSKQASNKPLTWPISIQQTQISYLAKRKLKSNANKHMGIDKQ